MKIEQSHQIFSHFSLNGFSFTDFLGGFDLSGVFVSKPAKGSRKSQSTVFELKTIDLVDAASTKDSTNPKKLAFSGVLESNLANVVPKIARKKTPAKMAGVVDFPSFPAVNQALS